MKKTYKTPATRVIICDMDSDMLSILVGSDTSNYTEDNPLVADSKYRNFDDYEEYDEEAYEEDLW